MTSGEVQTILQLLEAVRLGRMSVEEAQKLIDYIAENTE
jgi:hypothetical protein